MPRVQVQPDSDALRNRGATLVSIRCERIRKPRPHTNTRILPAQTSRKARRIERRLHPKSHRTAMMESHDVDMSSPSAPPDWSEPQYGGYSRFEIELEVRSSPMSSPAVSRS